MEIVLVHPRIPQNAGAVARLAAATQSKLILVRPLGFRMDSASVRRAGVDYWEHADVKVIDDLSAAIDEARGEIYFFSRFGQTSFWDVKYSAEDMLVFGNEDEGLPDEVRHSVPETNLLRIPIRNQSVRSLNLAASVSIALYEALRQIG